MSVVLSVEDTGTCRKEVTIEVPASAVEAETRNLVKLYSSQVNLPGFRKGKAPASIVRKRFRQEIDREVVEKLIPRFWEKAREEEGIDPLGQPQLKEIDDLADGGPLRFVTVVEVRPEVELGEIEPEEFELPEVEVEPSDDDVDAALDDLRRQIGDWKEVDRAAARGDLVTLRIVEEGAEEEASEEDTADAEAEAADDEATEADAEDPETGDTEPGDEVQIEVGDANVWEELSLAITGLEAGQEGRFTRRPPAPEEGEAADAPEPRTFKVKVKEVQERELPELDDELAKKLGDFDSVDELREAMASKLRHDRGHERDAKRREALMEQMRHRYPLPLPEGVLHEEAQVMLNDYARDMASKGVDPQNAGIDWEALGEQFKPHAMRRLHDRLLLDAVADRRDIEVTEAEVDGAIASVARAQGASFQQMSEALGDRRPGLAKQIRRDKAIRWLLDEEPQPEEDEAAQVEDEASEEAAGADESDAVASASDDSASDDSTSDDSTSDDSTSDDSDTDDSTSDETEAAAATADDPDAKS